MADLSLMDNVEAFAKAVAEKHAKLDVLVNNAVSTIHPILSPKMGLIYTLLSMRSLPTC